MIFVLLLVALLGACDAHPQSHRNYKQRVFLGVDDTEKKYPYVVALLKNNRRSCTGTLIAHNCVLTASHCDGTHIQYGDMTVPPEVTKSIAKILKTILHPSYQAFPIRRKVLYVYNDIALLQVESVDLSAYGTISALDYKSLSGQAVEYAGFGLTRYKDVENWKIQIEVDEVRPLQIGRGMVIINDETKIGMVVHVMPKCNKRQQALPGDSGGPLFHDGKIVGVACYTSLTMELSGYTPVSPYVEWIYDIVTGHH